MRPIKINFVMLVLAISLTFHQHAEAQYSVQNSVFGNGGAVIEDSSYRIVGTVGQPAIGMSSGEFKIYSGFWYLLTPPKLIYGDVSGNGAVTAYDASLVLQAVVGLKNLSPAEREAADVTNDDSVTALDAALILQHSVGLITQFPAEIAPTAAPALSTKSELDTIPACQ